MIPTLEILLPTYKRPCRAKEAIESVLSCNDDRLTIRCNSNGYEPDLEKYRNINKRLNYDCFQTNQGPQANVLKLFSNTNAKFCMILSDEDRVNSKHCNDMLDFLENLDESVNVVACSVFDPIKGCYHWKPSSFFSEISISSYVALNPLSTYMSGLIFRVKSLSDIDLPSLLTPVMGNAYAHLDITLKMLRYNKISFFHDKFVLKGIDAKYGGDGYSHISRGENKDISLKKNKDLNLYVYGPKARVEQFYYRENLLNTLKDNIGFLPLCIGRLNYLEFHFRSIMNSHNVVILPENSILKNEVLAGYNDSKKHEQFSGTLTSYLFIILLSLPKIISNLLFMFISTLNRLMRKIYLFHLTYIKEI